MRYSERGGIASKLLILVLIIISIGANLAIRIPQEITEEARGITEKDARNCELKLRILVRNGKNGKDFTADLTNTELNSFILAGYTIDGFEKIKKYTRQGKISVEDVRVDIASDEIHLTFKTYVKFKYLYVRLAGRLKTEPGKVVMLVDKVSIGKLPLPSQAAPLIANIVRPGRRPLCLALPDYVKSVGIKGDKLVIAVGR